MCGVSEGLWLPAAQAEPSARVSTHVASERPTGPEHPRLGGGPREHAPKHISQTDTPSGFLPNFHGTCWTTAEPIGLSSSSAFPYSRFRDDESSPLRPDPLLGRS